MTYIPRFARLPMTPRKAFMLGISEYTHYAILPGAVSDANRMNSALVQTDFFTALYTNIRYAKRLIRGSAREGNIGGCFKFSSAL